MYVTHSSCLPFLLPFPTPTYPSPSPSRQIKPPLDATIQSHISANLTPWPTSWDTSCLHDNPRLTDPLGSVLDGYFSEILQLCYRREENARSGVKVVYTPMHGVGADGARRAFKAFNLPDFIPVAEQVYILCVYVYKYMLQLSYVSVSVEYSHLSCVTL